MSDREIDTQMSKSFINLVQANVSNERLSDVDFRAFVKNSVPLCFKQTSPTERRLHESQRDSSSYPG